MAISRLGINYTCNLATGLAMEQMFQATTDVVDRKMREVWNKSTEIAGICHVLARHYTPSGAGPGDPGRAGAPDRRAADPHLRRGSQRAAVGLHQPEPCDRAHPSADRRAHPQGLGFPAPIAEVPRQHLDFTRNSPRADYTDLVQVATLQSYLGSEHPYTRLDWSQIPAFAKLGLEPTVDMKEDEDLSSALEAATSMLQ